MEKIKTQEDVIKLLNTGNLKNGSSGDFIPGFMIGILSLNLFILFILKPMYRET